VRCIVVGSHILHFKESLLQLDATQQMLLSPALLIVGECLEISM
jgi:hypothetical protein